tara:strand:- start:42 stop:377 length:336 start_codon:yes stop_codon:yes gene_type:complete
MKPMAEKKKPKEKESEPVEVECPCGCGEIIGVECPCGCGEIVEMIDTPYGRIIGSEDAKTEVFQEGCREDDQRVANAQRALHSRLSEGDRDRALRWTAYYRALLQEDTHWD